MSTDPVANKPRAGWVNALIGVVIGLAIGLTIGAAGAFMLKMDADNLLEVRMTEHASVLEAKDAELASIRDEVATLRSKAAGMGARIAVSRAVNQLDQRNFGTAQDELRRAQELIELAPEPVQAAAAGIEAVDLRVAVDAGTQRELLLIIAGRMDAAIMQ